MNSTKRLRFTNFKRSLMEACNKSADKNNNNEPESSGGVSDNGIEETEVKIIYFFIEISIYI